MASDKSTTKFKFLKNIKSIYQSLEDYKILLPLIIVLSTPIFFLYQFSMSYAIKSLADSFESGEISIMYKGITVMVITIIILAFIIVPTTFYYMNYMIVKIRQKIQVKFTAKFSNMKMSNYEDIKSGDLLQRFNDDINIYTNVFEKFRYVGTTFLASFGAIFTVLIMDYRLCLVMLVLGLLRIKITNKYSGKMTSLNVNLQKEKSKLISVLTENVNAKEIVRVYNMHKHFRNKFLFHNAEIKSNGMEQKEVSKQLQAINVIFEFMNYAGIIIIGVIMIYYNMTTIGKLVASIQLMSGAFEFFNSYPWQAIEVEKAVISLNRLREVLSIEEDICEEKAEEQPEINNYRIGFQDVTFGYDRDKNQLNSCNLTFEQGKISALVGKSGSGKSTITKLILKYYSNYKGAISIGGVDVNNISKIDLRNMIAYVSQENYLFNGTIYENILYGKPRASYSDVINAAKLAEIHDIIEKLDDKYNTRVGENGIKLSGGEKQRVALARAFLKNAPIIILDEPTSSLDRNTEQQIIRTIRKLIEGRTTIVISHSLDVIENAHDFYLMDETNIHKIEDFEQIHNTVLSWNEEIQIV